MKNLIPLKANAIAVFRAIVAAKNGPLRRRLTALLPLVRRRQRQYRGESMALERMHRARLRPRQTDDLIHCFKVSTKPLAKLRTAIIAAQPPHIQPICQYCGSNPRVRTFDHYLPKETFAEFSTFVDNLLPCCRDCNSSKGTAWLDRRGRRLVLHLYFDRLPETRYLAAKIEWNGSVPKAVFRLSPSARRYGGKRRLIQAHFKQLDLLRVYAEAAVVTLSEEVSNVRAFRTTQSVRQTAAIYRRKGDEWAKQFGSNYWKSVLMRAIAADARYLRQ